MENKRITPKEFSNKSQNDEILKKQLELREREIALKEKEMELKMLQRDKNSIEKEKMLLSREKFRYTKKLNYFSFAVIFAVIFAFVFAVIAGILMGISSEKSEPSEPIQESTLKSTFDKKWKEKMGTSEKSEPIQESIVDKRIKSFNQKTEQLAMQEEASSFSSLENNIATTPIQESYFDKKFDKKMSKF